MIKFERGGDIQRTLKIGKHAPIKRGDSFIAEFRLRNSCPEFYPLQRKKFIEVKALIDEDSPISNIYSGHIPVDVDGVDYSLYARYDKKEEIWVIE